jgi:flagellar basal-body rod modification protein FlgD
VAQLAQFSQLEALTNMQTSLDTFVSSMSGERMLNSASLIGKKVAVSDAYTSLVQGGTIDANIDLPQGAAGLQINVHDAKGNLVREIAAGAQLPGNLPVQWDGKNSTGQAATPGLYRLTAQGVINGKQATVPVNTLATVKSISTHPTDGSVSVEVDGGKTLLLSDVKRVGS